MGYQLIETIEVGSGGATSIEFTGIPQDGVDLQVLFSIRGDATTSAVRIWENGNTSQGSNRNLTGDGSGAYSFANLSYIALANGSTSTASVFGNGKLYIPNYTNTGTKTFSLDSVNENNATNGSQAITAANSFGTAAITSLKILFTTGSLVQYSSASIYKITAD